MDYGKTMMKLIDVVERPQVMHLKSSVITQVLFKLSPSTSIFREKIVPNRFQFVHTFVFTLDTQQVHHYNRPLEEEDFKLLGEVFGRYQSLRTLVVSLISSTAAETLRSWTVKHLVAPVAEKLELLRLITIGRLGKTSLTAEDVEFIGENCLSLQHLKLLSNKDVGQKSFIPIVSNLHSMKKLPIYSLKWNDALMELASENLVMLEELVLEAYGSSKLIPLTEKGFALLSQFNNLKVLVIAACPTFTFSNLIDVVLNPANFPQLEHLKIAICSFQSDGTVVDHVVFNEAIHEFIKSKKNTFKNLYLQSLHTNLVDDECVVNFILPALKECLNFIHLALYDNDKLKKISTINLLLKELPDSMIYFAESDNGNGDFEKVEYDKQLVEERKKRGAWNFIARVKSNQIVE